MTVTSVQPLSPGLSTEPYAWEPAPEKSSGFARVLTHYLSQATAQQTTADRAVLDLATGKTEDVHNVMLAVAKADLAFRTVLEVRNRLTEAYQEIARMQV